MRLTKKQAYLAMYYYLDDLCGRINANFLGEFLCYMVLLDTGMPVDFGIWEDWEEAVGRLEKDSTKEFLTENEAHLAMCYFLETLYKLTDSREIAKILKNTKTLNGSDLLIEPVIWNDWQKAIEKAKEWQPKVSFSWQV